MIYKNSKRMRDSLGLFIFIVVLVFYILGAFLTKQLFRYAPRWLSYPMRNDVNKKDRPNTTPTVRAICTFAVYFSVFRPFFRFTLAYEGHFVLCYKEKTRAVRSC